MVRNLAILFCGVIALSIGLQYVFGDRMEGPAREFSNAFKDAFVAEFKKEIGIADASLDSPERRISDYNTFVMFLAIHSMRVADGETGEDMFTDTYETLPKDKRFAYEMLADRVRETLTVDVILLGQSVHGIEPSEEEIVILKDFGLGYSNALRNVTAATLFDDFSADGIAALSEDDFSAWMLHLMTHPEKINNEYDRASFQELVDTSAHAYRIMTAAMEEVVAAEMEEKM